MLLGSLQAQETIHWWPSRRLGVFLEEPPETFIIFLDYLRMLQLLSVDNLNLVECRSH